MLMGLVDDRGSRREDGDGDRPGRWAWVRFGGTGYKGGVCGAL